MTRWPVRGSLGTRNGTLAGALGIIGRRLPLIGVLTGCVLAGMLFAPVFGMAAVLPPTLAVAVVGYAVEEAILHRPGLARVRVPLTLAGGVAAVAVVVPGALTNPVSLWHGASSGWRRTLESTWPARPDPELVSFVPLLVLLACLVGARLLASARVWSVLPAVLLAGLAQAYVTTSGLDALLVGLGLVGCCCLVLLRWPADRGGWISLAASMVAILVGATTLGLLPPDRAAAQLPRPNPPDTPAVLSNPLTEVAARLRSPDEVVFTVRSDRPVDRWTLLTLDNFDGVTWSVDPELRRLGRELPLDPRVTVPVDRRTAEISLSDESLPLLPNRSRTRSVAADSPLLVDPGSGALLPDGPSPSRYQVTWTDPDVGTERLSASDVQRDRIDGSLGKVPPAIDQLADDIAGDLRPSFQMALVLEKYLRANYQPVSGGELPTGHGYPQLSHFLLESKRGTSEQFATAYVVLARLVGLPARVAVGFRQPPQPSEDGRYVVRNGDILAWPEVAVQGIGWVPLDPTGTIGSAASGDGLADTAETARRDLPPTQELERQHRAEPVAPSPPSGTGQGPSSWILPIVLGVGLLLATAGWLGGVPLAKTARRRRRRRLGTVGAWAEARDLLRDHGTRVSASATARDLARGAEEPVAEAITLLADCLDRALWSGQRSGDGPDPDSELAWSAVRAAHEGLVAGRMTRRLRMACNPRGLFDVH